jgi:hypothetical protein
MENNEVKLPDILIKNHPELYARIINADNKNNISIIESKAGGKIPAVFIDGKNIYIHSKYDPCKEAERFISEIDPLAFTLFIVFGFGFAYHIEELKKFINNNCTVLIIEKNPLIIKNAIIERDLTGILNDERIRILCDPDEDNISDALKGLSSRKVSFLTHRGSFQIDPEYYTNMRGILRSYLSVKDVNIATLSRFEKIWMSNITRNILEFVNLPGAGIFYDKFRGLPTIIAGAGPSLNSSMEFIKSNNDKAVIICVDTSYNILIKNNIIPHFCLTVDAQLINARYFEGCINDKTIFITDPCVHPSAFRLIRGRKAVFSIPFDMMKWVEDIAGAKGELAYGGSVSTNAYDFAKRIGASPVVLTGQDFAFTGDLAHARGAYLDEEAFFRTGRFYNAEMKNRFQLNAIPKIQVKGITGRNAITNQKLMIFLNWFEKRNDPDLINAGPDGAFIKGVRHMAHDNLSFPEIDVNIREIITAIYNKKNNSIQSSQVKDEIAKRCGIMMKEIRELIPALTRAVSLSGELIVILRSRKGQEKIDYILKRLTETDRLVESMTSLKDMIGFTIQRVIHTITEGYEIDPDDTELTEQQLTAKKSHFLYKGILEGTEFNYKKLNKMMKLLAG